MQHLERKARKRVKREERIREKLEMKRSLKFGLSMVAVFFISISVIVGAMAQENKLEVTYFAKSHHFLDYPYNEKHNFIGLELRDNISGYGIANFKNSYFENSLMMTYSRYWQPYKNIELNLSTGIATGYDKLGRCPTVSGNSDLCPIFSGGITFTKYKYFKPRLSLLGRAIVLSISGEL